MSNLWKKGSMRLVCGFIVGVLAGILGCAGLQSRQKKIENCGSSRDIILSRSDQEACDPELLDQYEEQVNNWGVTCFSLVPEEDSQQVWARLLFARECRNAPKDSDNSKR
jgi:hypothetical protein